MQVIQRLSGRFPIIGIIDCNPLETSMPVSAPAISPGALIYFQQGRSMIFCLKRETGIRCTDVPEKY
jgi:hypothetical protein